MPRSKKLTYEQKVQIRLLYKQGGYSLRELGKKFNVSKSLIDMVVKNDPADDRPQIQIVKSDPPRIHVDELNYISDPILFRIQKLKEIFLDLDACRDARSMGPLTGLHKLQLDLHDQITALKKAAGEIDEDLNPDEMIIQFEQAFLSLPPLVKDQLIDLFTAETSNVVSIGEKSWACPN